MKTKNNKKARFLSDDFTRVIMLILGCVCSTLVLTFSVLTIVAVTKSNFDDAPNFLFWVFISMGLSSLVTYIRNRSRYNLIRVIILFAFNLALGIVVTYAKNDTYLFSLTAGLYCLVVIVSRIFNIIEKKSIRAIVFNAIVILIAMLLGVGLFIPVEADDLAKVVLIECLFITITALAEVAGIAFGELKFKVLFKIIVKTFALEVLFGLIATMVASALVLMTVEETITNFGDALWYCFAVVTTIGFGDFAATTVIGRLITVVLGMYGIIAVAVVTSIIVNFYNETSGKNDAKKLKSIEKEENDK